MSMCFVIDSVRVSEIVNVFKCLCGLVGFGGLVR